MNTFVESRPEEHPTKRTTFVRLDDECKITIGVEDGAAPRVDTQYNFSGLVTQYNIPRSEPNIQAVYTVEREETQMCRIAVRMYHGANATGNNLPISGFYDYKPGTGWCFFDARSNGEDVGVGPQEFPVVLWDTTEDISRTGSLPGENTEPSLITDAIIREQLDAKAISEGRGINYNTRYSNLGEFLKHLGEIGAGREDFFRGESKHHKPGMLINSGLCREVLDDFHEYGKEWDPLIDLPRSVFATQKCESEFAKWLQSDRSYSLGLATRSSGFASDFPKDINEADFHQEDLQFLAEIQHYGGKTFLVDFTKDIDIALFFACMKNPEKDDCLDEDEDGRLMLLPKEHAGKMWDRISPSKSFDRYCKQKSVLVVPRLQCLLPNGSGFSNVDDGIQCVVFNIPKELKRDIIEYLAREKNITRESLGFHGGYERIPDEIREYIEERKSMGRFTVFIPRIYDTTVTAS